MIKILGIVRKSPSNDPEASIELQKERIKARVGGDYYPEEVDIIWAIDICSGDDELGRTSLSLHFTHIHEFAAAYCLNVDRFSRSWLGLKWFHTYFKEGKPQLRFVETIPALYNAQGHVNEDVYLYFFMQCGFAEYELMKIRTRSDAGRAALTEEEWKSKYKGRPKGSKNKLQPI
jgi:hypothetical protein